jgi:hypothetical protein
MVGDIIQTSDRVRTPHIALGTGDVRHVAFSEGYSGETSTVKYMRYSGGAWSAPVDLYSSVGRAVKSNLDAPISGNRVYVVYDDVGWQTVYLRISEDNGASWQPAIYFNEPHVGTYEPDIEANSLGTVVIVWNSGGMSMVRYVMSEDYGATWTAPFRLDASSGAAQYPRICMRAGTYGIVWQDDRDGNNEIYMTAKKL